MADELNQVLSGDQTEPLQPQTGAEEFDAERAKALIAKLRGEEKRAKQLEKELALVRQGDEERKRVEMTEIERMKADLQKERDARTRLEQEYETSRRNNVIVAAAAKAGMYDPDDAIALLANVGVDEVPSTLESLRTAKPYLFKTTTTTTSPTYSPTNPAGGAATPSDNQILQEIYGGRKSNLFAGGGVFGPNNSE